MRLLYVSTFRIPHTNGTSKRFIDEMNYFSANNGVTCLSAPPYDPNMIKLINPQVRRYTTPDIARGSFVSKIIQLPYLMAPFYVYKIWKISRDEHIDAIMAHDIFAAFFSSIALLGSKTVLTLHSTYSEDCLFMSRTATPVLRPFYFLKRFFGSVIEHIVYRSVSAIICVSEYEEKDVLVKTKNKKQPTLIRNWVDEKKYSSISRSEALKKTGFNTKKVNGIFIGRVVPKNGPKIILEAIKRVSSNRKDFIFYFVGSGYELEDCKKSAERFENIVFLGERADVPELLSSSDFFVSHVSSLVEGVGFTILEAMAAGKPVICGEDRITKSLFKDEVFLVKKDDPSFLIPAITKLVDSEQLRIETGKKALGKVRSDFSMTASLNKIDRILKGLVK